MLMKVGPPDGLLSFDGCEDGLFRQYVLKMRPEINEHVETLLSSYCGGNELGPELQGLMSGGKRLRAGLALLTFDTLAMDDGKRDAVLDLAAAIEIAHSTSLILDDMLDGDEMRRGKKAVHVSNGHRKALLEMTGLLSVPYSIVNVHGSKYTALLARTHRAVVEGELEQVDAGRDCTLERYERVISLKTGQMFALAACFGAMASERSDQLTEQMSRFGLSLGAIMQVADDVADLRAWTKKGALPDHGSEMLLWSSLGRPPLSLGAQGRTEVEVRAIDLLNGFIRCGENVLISAPFNTPEGRPGSGHQVACLRSAPRDIAEMMVGERSSH